MANYNPYAAPQAVPPMPAGPAYPGASGPQPWELGEVLGHAWNMFKPSWATLVFSMLLGSFITAIPGQLPGILVQTGAMDAGDIAYTIIALVCMIVNLLLNAFFQVGFIKIWLSAARGQAPQFADLFAGGSRFFPLLGTMILSGLAIFFGFLLLIVPGVILGLGLSLASYYCVDQRMGPIDAMKASWAATTGQKGKIFLFGLVSVLLIICGYIACICGAFVAIPVVMVGMATIYLRLSGMMGGPTMYGGGGPAGYPPPAGYGAPPAGGFGAPPGGGYGPPGGGGYGGPPGGGGYGGPPGGGGYGGPPGGGPPGGGGYGGPPGGGGYGGPPPGGGGGYGPQGY
jgi:uncharacterized membrane protein